MKVLSFSLFGNYAGYFSGVVKNLLASAVVYPEYEFRLYVGKDCPVSMITRAEFLGARVIVVDTDRGGIHGMFWRFYALNDLTADVVLVRDLDSTVNWRERAAVDEWLESGLAFHVMRDSPEHIVPVMGGMFGYRPTSRLIDFSIEDRASTWLNLEKGGDQEFLAKFVWPLVRSKTMAHGIMGKRLEYFNPSFNDAVDVRPFPPHPPIGKYFENSNFVGAPDAGSPLAVAIMSSDQNPYYMDFWPSVSKAWREVVNMAPVLVVVDKAGPTLRDGHGIVLQYALVPGIPNHLQAQNARIHAATLFEDITVLTSDIDMMPLQANYYWFGIKKAQDVPVTLCDNAYNDPQKFPICYLAATGHKWKDVIGAGPWESYVTQLNNIYPQEYTGQDVHPKWNIDEEYTSQRLAKHGVMRIAGWPTAFGLRCDRSNWSPDYDKLAKHQLVDAHLLRPYSSYKEQIDHFSSVLIGPKKKSWGFKLPSPDAWETDFFDITNWNNHRPLLWLALQATEIGKVLELGAGDGSTPLLRKYCKQYDRPFFSYDNNLEWATKHEAEFVPDWESHPMWQSQYSVAFVDHAPGEHRHLAIHHIMARSDIIVIHDTEPAATGYMLDKIWPMFRHKVNLRRLDAQGAWASAVSNSRDFGSWPHAFQSNGVTFTVEVEK